ncbi:nicotinamidase-related amidase [Dysgonomonas alginatilytica]|uniref:Nicotinamidase-related amidase n=1 Tax=Dysgonomonas alginatilytica TaxID=1605892 RepID=A0A2V3PMG9_9BACT|nr:isochorismatase family protein [Dysgonomonas alginatilytica]PXV62687.1 nicotinamidase-related amidase [Dysgonomonas alginatilytica]
MKEKIAVLGIDIQNDFTQPTGALFVNGADADVRRMATFIEEYGSSIDYVALTMDSHQPIHIANQHYWKDKEGYPPALFTVIHAEDVESEKWMPQFNQDRALGYLKALEEKAEVCTIWPAHCIQGSKGWSINEILIKALYSWSINEGKTYDLFYKGTHQATEHYSIFKAAVEFEDSEETKLNKELLSSLEEFDKIIIMGEAADYCVANSLNDILEFSPHLAKRVIVLSDCISWINPENERAIKMYEKAKLQGVRFATSDQFRD